jgi:hypothetical protein
MFKKSFLPFSIAFLFSVLVFAVFMPAFAAGQDDILPPSYLGGYPNLINSFPKILVDDAFGETTEVIRYPDEYAGAFLDDSGKLHIVLTKNAAAGTESEYRQIMGSSDIPVVFDVAEFPLFFLYEVQRTLEGVMGEFSISTISINEVNNRVDIGLLDLTRQQDVVDFLKTNFDEFDADCLIFAQGSLLRISLYTDDDEHRPTLLEYLVIATLFLIISAAIGALFLSYRKKQQNNEKVLEPQTV